MKFVNRLNFWARDASNESAALLGAHTLGVLRALAGPGPGPSLEAVRVQVGGDPRGVRSVVEPLLGLGFARRDAQGGLGLDPALREALAQPAFSTALDQASALWHPLRQLPDALRSGEPVSHRGQAVDLLGHYRQRFATPAGPGVVEDFLDRATRNVLRCQALIASGAVGLLQSLTERGGGTLAELAQATGTRPAALEVLLGVLESMGVVHPVEGRWLYTAEAGEPLGSATSLPYFLRALPATTEYWEALGELPSAVRERRFLLDLKNPEHARRIYSENAARISAIFGSHLRLGRTAAERVKTLRSLQEAEVLDVGTGSGVWGAAFAQAEPTARITYLDSDYVLEGVKKNLARLKLSNPARFWAADCTTVDLGERTYDLVLLPQIIPVLLPHELPGLFSRVARALKPGGMLAVSGYVLTDQRDGPMDALYFALRRYLTNEGEVLSMPEFHQHLGQVGLVDIQRFPLPVQDLVLATRPA